MKIYLFHFSITFGVSSSRSNIDFSGERGVKKMPMTNSIELASNFLFLSHEKQIEPS